MNILDKKWKTRLIELTKLIASWSKDPSTKTGALIVTKIGEPVSFGFNGFPKGVDDDESLYNNREFKLLACEHAERNAIYQATVSLKGCVLYTTHHPCASCARAIIQSGITHVIIDESILIQDTGYNDRWTEELKVSKWLFNQANVTVLTSGDDNNEHKQ
ncbi:tRNA-specific adenosine deaminase [Pseudomonas phage vB_PaeM_MIJ3]|nr:tRNA-specific adenosine deaminase [Pseudomonas phage vB_PaeM_MIJ3]